MVHPLAQQDPIPQQFMQPWPSQQQQQQMQQEIHTFPKLPGQHWDSHSVITYRQSGDLKLSMRGDTIDQAYVQQSDCFLHLASPNNQDWHEAPDQSR